MERLLDHFKPIRYNLEECIWRSEGRMKGKVEITGDVCSDVIKFHATDLKLELVEAKVYLPDNEGPDEAQCYYPLEYTYDGQVIAIPIAGDFKKALYHPEIVGEGQDYVPQATIKIFFETKLNTNMQGCYLSSYEWQGKKQLLAATQFESHYAREAFPCIDEPAAKAVFDLTIIIPDYTPIDVVLANMPVISQVNGKFEFASTPRMSTYLLAWVAGPLQSVSIVNQNDVKVSSYAALNQPLSSLIFANETASRALEYFDGQFREKYPLPKLDQVALPDFEAGAMENWGLVTYRESMLLADKTATLDTKRSIAKTITHELSHQWFGDLVTMAWWDDLWLNESFASVIEFFATDALYPDFKIWQDFFTGDCLAALKRDCLPGVQAVKQEVHQPSEIATLFDSAIVYAKGARLILMLLRLMGEAQFFKGLQDYFDTYKYQNTIGDDLWESLQPYADFDVKAFMASWLSQPGYPVLLEPDVVESAKRFLIDGSTDDQTWSIPEIKDDMSGHYLLNLSQAEFEQKLATFDQLSDEQKLRLMLDRMLLAKTPAVTSSSLLDLLPKFIHERSAAVWNILATIMGDLKLFCPPDTEAAADYKRYLRSLLQDEFQQLDFAPLEDVDATTLRDLMLGVAYYSEDESVLRRLADLYQDNLSELDPELRSHILGAKFYFDEDEVFDAWLKQYQTLSDPELKYDLLYTLASFTKLPKHQERMLGLLNEPTIVRPQDHIFLYIYLLRNHHTREQTLDWLTTHWDDVVELTGEKSIEDYPRYAANLLRTPAEVEKFYAFFDPKSEDPILSRTIKVAHTELDSRLKLIAEDSAAVTKKLKSCIA